jgi:hypothetical protein
MAASTVAASPVGDRRNAVGQEFCTHRLELRFGVNFNLLVFTRQFVRRTVEYDNSDSSQM